MMDTEQLARIEGDRQTLGSAKAYTDQRETAINSRTDSLVASEHDARIAGDANTLASAGNYSTSASANSMTGLTVMNVAPMPVSPA